MGSLNFKAIVAESKKIRADRGEDFFENKKRSVSVDGIELTSKIHSAEDEINFESIHESHAKLNHLICKYDKKFLDQSSRVLNEKKKRSKSIHLYVDESIEHFLNIEANKVETKWGLRKNAGLGQLIQKFILNFMELKKREERQLRKVKKIIDDFRSNLVEFKTHTLSHSDFQNAEVANQKMKVLSNDLRIILALLEFEEAELRHCLGEEVYDWIQFVIQWKFQS